MKKIHNYFCVFKSFKNNEQRNIRLNILFSPPKSYKKYLFDFKMQTRHKYKRDKQLFLNVYLPQKEAKKETFKKKFEQRCFLFGSEFWDC